VLLVGPRAGFSRRILEELAEVPSTASTAARRATTLSLAALASTAVESKNSSSPHTRPASTHIWTILSKKARKTSRP
jgi:hypothetical protein